MLGDEQVPIIVVGSASSVPGRTKEQGAAMIKALLQSAADDKSVLDSDGCQGQYYEWVHQRCILTQLDVGHNTWKYFKKNFQTEIELYGEEQWVRRRPCTE